MSCNCEYIDIIHIFLYIISPPLQMSSRLQSIVSADVLVHLPGFTASKPTAVAGDILRASVLRYDFISKYE